MKDLLTKFSNTCGSFCCTWYGSEEFTKESRRYSLELCVPLLKSCKKGNGSNLPDLSGPLAQSAPALLPTRKLTALPTYCIAGNFGEDLNLVDLWKKCQI